MAAVFFFCLSLAYAQQGPPNILFFLTDDLGIGEVSPFRHTPAEHPISTPSLERMASEGMLFTDAYSGAPVCSPSRCTLMTGKHTGHSTIRGNGQGGLDPEADVTVAQLLRDLGGYHTALFGKWHLGNDPWNWGFDRYTGFISSLAGAGGYYPEQMHRHKDGQTEILLFPENENSSRERCTAPNNTCTYSPSAVYKHARSWISSRVSHQEEPWFMLYSTVLAHKGHWASPLPEGAPVPHQGEYANMSWPEEERDRASQITGWVDKQLGGFLDLLDELEIDERTVVFFAADNGARLPDFFDGNDIFRGAKFQLLEGGIRTPAMVRWKGTVQPGSVSSHQWAFWDFLATATDLAGISPAIPADGISILPALLGTSQPEHQYLYWEFCRQGLFAQALRQGNKKIVRNRVDRPWNLYDLEEDPRELTDLAAGDPQTVAEMEALAQSARTDSDDCV